MGSFWRVKESLMKAMIFSLGEHRIQIDQVKIPEAFQEIIIEDEA